MNRPPPILSVYALNAVLIYKSARDLCGDFGGGVLFPCGFARDLCNAILNNQPHPTPPSSGPAKVEADAWLDAMEWHVPMLDDNPDDDTWGVHVVRAQATKRSSPVMVELLRWGMGQVPRLGVDAVLFEINRVAELLERQGVAA